MSQSDEQDGPPPLPIPSQPSGPIVASYTWASDVPAECSRPASTGSAKVPCVLGVDEAGRGPVLGPLVYGIAYCPASYQDELKQIGFADSKALTAEKRDTLLHALIADSHHLGWAVRVMSPQDISAGMLRRRPINLNAQSSQATVALISAVLESGVDVTEIYVDTVGDPKSYARLLASHFPRHTHINWTVTSKADAIYPIVGAASIAAKVTRDRCIEAWQYAESSPPPAPLRDSSNLLKRTRTSSDRLADSKTQQISWPHPGSGYPGDPNTVAFLKAAFDPVFGWPGIVRFSWATAKTLLDEKVRPPSTASPRKTVRSRSTAPATAAAVASESPYGTRVPTTGTRGYKVKWTDEPVAISKFFAPAAGSTAADAALEALAPADTHDTKAWVKQVKADQRANREGGSRIRRELGISACTAGWMLE